MKQESKENLPFRELTNMEAATKLIKDAATLTLTLTIKKAKEYPVIATGFSISAATAIVGIAGYREPILLAPLLLGYGIVYYGLIREVVGIDPIWATKTGFQMLTNRWRSYRRGEIDINIPENDDNSWNIPS